MTSPGAPLLLPRALAGHLTHAARVMPVVVLTGARQTGKSTLARMFDAEDIAYLTLEIPEVLGRARDDPAAFVAQARTLVIDEVQRDPDLLLAIKTAVDADVPRRPGRFLLTGSANLLLMKRVRESLAGRAVYLTLHPMTRREQLGLGEAGIWTALLDTPHHEWRDLVLGQSAPFEDWRDLARRGGYPPAVEIQDDDDRWLWFDGYVQTYLQRDIPELAAIDRIHDFDTVLRSIALRVGTFVNQTQLARDSGIPQSTVHRYVNLLETSYQVYRLNGYAINRTRQLVKSPKYYWSDAGLALAISREREPRGEHFENIILQDLLVWRDSRTAPPELFCWRTSKGYEVDFVIDDGHTLLPVEVKTTNQPSTRDLASMKVFLEEYADRAPAGLLLYTGDHAFWIAKNILAAPWWMVI